MIHARSESGFDAAAKAVTLSYTLSDEPPQIGPLIARRLEGHKA
jgi:hypothetical protein